MGSRKGGATIDGLQPLHLAGEGPPGTSPGAMLTGARSAFRVRSALCLVTGAFGMQWHSIRVMVGSYE